MIRLSMAGLIRPAMSPKLGDIAFSVFSFSTTYMILIWSHEFGHSLRAEQVGGHFNIHNANLPIPHTTMTLPDSISLVDETLSVTAGFEVNYLNVRTIQRDFMKNNGASNTDLAFAFANRIMFPLYTSVILPFTPEERDVWINTAGDPVHVILPVWKNYSDGQVFMADSSVNPDLVDLYGETALLGTYWNLLDPHFYKEVAASFGDETVERKPIWLIGDAENGWTYGTLFNVSPLGYELYMNNYINLDGKALSVYFKTGRPFKNNGLGLVWNEFLTTDKMTMTATVDAWDQDIFGSGVAAELTTDMWVADGIDLILHTGYKTEGYVLGKQIPEGFTLGMGLRWSD
ncbi:MAG: hypothetical protein K9N38_02755 [Candidatus Marinimicrobia bacterium]|nr:hypothetical protein [Candidatus Neomarinimicrobiota bacterium]MCF7850196.1 hypothetical protein [Candidatus Neomarinimicrobiota bacterium]